MATTRCWDEMVLTVKIATQRTLMRTKRCQIDPTAHSNIRTTLEDSPSQHGTKNALHCISYPQSHAITYILAFLFLALRHYRGVLEGWSHKDQSMKDRA